MLKYFFVFLLNFSFFAQVKGIVVDAQNKPVPYVNIFVENQELGTTTEENSMFSIQTSLENTLIFTALGFETKKVKTSEAQKVILREKIYVLSEVTITNPKKTKEIEIGNFYENEHFARFASEKTPLIVAQFFPNNSKINDFLYFKEITFKTITKNKKAKIIINFYDVNKDGSPGNNLLEEYFVFNLKKGNKINKVNIEKLKLTMPENGVFVGFEWILIEDNFYTFTYKKSSDLIKKKYKDGVHHDPFISAVPSLEHNTWMFWKEKWYKCNYIYPKKYVPEEIVDKFYELAINLTLTN